MIPTADGSLAVASRQSAAELAPIAAEHTLTQCEQRTMHKAAAEQTPSELSLSLSAAFG